jgi:hypothetical protein
MASYCITDITKAQFCTDVCNLKFMIILVYFLWHADLNG